MKLFGVKITGPKALAVGTFLVIFSIVFKDWLSMVRINYLICLGLGVLVLAFLFFLLLRNNDI